ncbi:MAG: CPBP family intramembrane metalloprotease [Anaerolineae bacterium]|jgi:membrane protease YdiL (CAAX protease family)|nr:CPBP family intramembrane metalloprotease [Anaerolineae bacterium]MBT4456697.1 CPBP family intramembrane metalloprotease [Anaerolineae bacterium]MBT4843289.1 CPBP family intramembrane metalloprotease [Anaerolineae bacterium]MBT6320997.1 CPBP family intramembrane metalloprotease [Anaerolineae bacterium]MBT6813217.1 CPBP family intramembrane metalloprotease [Anaerolineae bacterium]
MNKTIRNLIIVALFTIGGGWLGVWLNNVTGNTQPPLQSLGALVWLITPALSGILLRAFGGDGWRDAGFGLHLISGWKWYLVAILVYPLAALLTFGLATLMGAVSTDGFATQGFDAYLSAVGIIAAGSLMKNIFEEFAWRGYLTPRLEAAKVPALLNHLIVGVLWWAWHIPYYYYFLDRTVLGSYLGNMNISTFLVLALISILLTAILFGELRLLSKSVWPVFILHNLINGLSMPLILNGFIKLNGWSGIILSPTNDGIIASILLGVAGLLLYRYRVQMKADK